MCQPEVNICTNTIRDQALIHEQQKLNTELLELREWTEQRMNKQMKLHDRMVVYYDRKLTKCNVYEEELERTRTENARFKFTSQCLVDKIKELTNTIVEKYSTNPLNNDEVNDSNKDENCNIENNQDKDNDNDTDPIATYLEVCSKTLIDEVGAYKEQVEKATIELGNLKDQLTRSVEKQVVLRECVNELTVLSKTERMKRDQDELELRTTVDRLTAELVEVQQEMDRLQSVEAEISVKLMHRESEQDDLDEAVRSENARLQAQLGKSAILEASMQSKIYDLELELSKRREASKMQQEPYQISFDSETIDGSSTSSIMYQCTLSRTSDDQVASFPDLGRGDDQLIPCLLSSTKSCVVAEDAQLSCSKSTNYDCQPSCLDSANDEHQPSCLDSTNDDHKSSGLDSANDDHQPSCSTLTAVKGSAQTASEPSLDELKNRQLAEIIKKYVRRHDDNC
ncbi:unnamed protein product [Macrosiphum euphorbiae]|uniref:Uncharacterized protein n=1 Tax=Macrosiphum euphorbiae TaxID=13131 RepID=A0AAV0WMB0_9HEMI|nr:unnamed protein product [Macrosiphum euphorbiae]